MRRFLKPIAAAVVALAVVCLCIIPALAQQPAVTPAPTAIESFFATIRGPLQDIATAAFTALALYIGAYIRSKWGIDIMQIATRNAAGIYASTGDMPRAVEYLKTAAPQTIKQFGIADEHLPEKIVAQAGLLEAAGTQIPVPPGTVDHANPNR